MADSNSAALVISGLGAAVSALAGIVTALVAFLYKRDNDRMQEDVKKLGERCKDLEKRVHDAEIVNAREGAEFAALKAAAEQTREGVEKVGSDLGDFRSEVSGSLAAINTTLHRVVTQTGTPPPMPAMRQRNPSRPDR